MSTNLAEPDTGEVELAYHLFIRLMNKWLFYDARTSFITAENLYRREMKLISRTRVSIRRWAI